MHVRSCLSYLAVMLLALAFTRTAAANPFLDRLMPADQVAADPNADYTLTQDDGPWFILAASLSGPNAAEQARQLTLELRQRYHLEAYTHEITFDFSKQVLDQFGRPGLLRYRMNKVIREIAVLVGNYPTADDPDLQSTLKKIKHLQPDALQVDKQPGDKSGQSLAMMRRAEAALLSDTNRRKKEGAMGHAFVTRNPLLSREYFVPQGVDEFVAKMNAGVQYSLLDCPGIYTIKVATFTGTVKLLQATADQAKQQKLQSKLAQAADNAHRLTIALREKGYEAYEFHDRSESIVTVGSFDSVGTDMFDGTTKYHPQVEAIRRTFSAGNKPTIHPQADQSKMAAAYRTFSSTSGGIQPAAGIFPKHLIGIPFDVQCAIYPVPKRSISADYARQVGYP